METLPVTIDRERAAELYRAYQVHQHYEKPIDEEIRRTYRLIAQGRVIIQALESIKLAGRNDEGWPKLAIARADQKSQWCTLHSDGSATMQPSHGSADRAASRRSHSSGRPAPSRNPLEAIGEPKRWCR